MFFMLLLLAVVVGIIYYVALYPVDVSMPTGAGTGTKKESSVAGSEEQAAVTSSGSKSDENAGSPFALRARRPGAPTPVPVYLVGPVEVRKMLGKDSIRDSEVSRGTSERSVGKPSKEKKSKSHRRTSKLPVPASEGEKGKDATAKKRSGSSGRHHRKKEASSSGSRKAGSSEGSKGNQSPKSKAEDGKVRKSGGSKERSKERKDGSRSRSRSGSRGKTPKKDRKHASPLPPALKESKKPVKL
ncbi:hypothetical protein Mgra_00002406 [Meloidogyne graminicola]|uniref:Uncharacterized protein n=1 Tax=Meloidogyne graminicola TaxID=189291 RepID=A0A8S9ZYH6_9BILA|nr:hypothetical protein Mgra_00002406 [Meloidogyne graminicola]